MTTSGGLLATCGVPSLAAPHATCSPAFNSFFTGEFKVVRSVRRPHRSCFCQSRTEIICAHGVPSIFAGLFGQHLVEDSRPFKVVPVFNGKREQGVLYQFALDFKRTSTGTEAVELLGSALARRTPTSCL